MKTRKQQPPGLNCKGLPSKRWADDPSRTKRGKGRAERKRGRRCRHEFKRVAPVIGTSYNSDRIQRETTQEICTKCKLRRHIGIES
jgi:hypothetical protein